MPTMYFPAERIDTCHEYWIYAVSRQTELAKLSQLLHCIINALFITVVKEGYRGAGEQWCDCNATVVDTIPLKGMI